MKLTFGAIMCLLPAIGFVNAACCEMASNPSLCGFDKETTKPGDVTRLKGGDLLGAREALICCCSATTCPSGGGCVSICKNVFFMG